jgi:Immunity protein 52
MRPIGIVGHLRPGWVDTNTIAARLARFFEALADTDPMFGGWIRSGSRRHYSIVPAAVTMPPDEIELRAWIDENPVFGSREGRKQRIGHSLQAITPEQRPLRANFWLSFKPDEWWFAHRMGISIFSGSGSPSPLDGDEGPQVLTALLRRVLVVTGTAWDCDWAGVMPGRYPVESDPICTPGPIKYQSGWMVYLAAAHAARIVRPQDVTVDRLAGEAMLLAATADEMFNSQNSNHWAAARRIQAALTPLNKLENDRSNDD